MTTENVNSSESNSSDANENDQKQSMPNVPPPKVDDLGLSRKDQAKAFYRSLYAGEAPNINDLMPNATEASSSKVCASCEHLQGEVGDLEKKLADSQGLYKRMAADFENYRKRIDRERDEYRVLGVQRAIESILAAMDDFDRAKLTINPNMDISKIIDNINVVHNSFIRCFEALGVKPLDAVGQIFDPRLHEPVQEIPTNDHPDNSVIHELRKGYQLNDKIIRPALVNVAAKIDPSTLSSSELKSETVVNSQNVNAADSDSAEKVEAQNNDTNIEVQAETKTDNASKSSKSSSQVNENIAKLFGAAPQVNRTDRSDDETI